MSCLFAISCSKNTDSSEEIDISNLNLVKFEQILTSINLDIFKNNQKVVFKNDIGTEKIMSINLTETNHSQNVNGKEIVLPKVAVNYYAASDINYALYFYLTTNILNNIGDQTAYLSASIFTNLVKFTPSLGFDHLGNPLMCTYNQNKALLGKTFHSVYSSIPAKEYEIFSELHFSKSSGIVGFRDTNNELWVFDRFEK